MRLSAGTRYLAVGTGGAWLEVQGQVINAARALLWGGTVGATGNGRCRHWILLSQRRENPLVSVGNRLSLHPEKPRSLGIECPLGVTHWARGFSCPHLNPQNNPVMYVFSLQLWFSVQPASGDGSGSGVGLPDPPSPAVLRCLPLGAAGQVSTGSGQTPCLPAGPQQGTFPLCPGCWKFFSVPGLERGSLFPGLPSSSSTETVQAPVSVPRHQHQLV